MPATSNRTPSPAFASATTRIRPSGRGLATIVASLVLTSCAATSQGVQKPAAAIKGANLIARTENLVCRGEAVFPLDNDVLGLTLSFEKPDADGARGIAAWSKGQDGIFAQCRVGKVAMSLDCLAAAGPVAIPMLLRFSSDMTGLTGWFGSPYGSETDIPFKTQCEYGKPR